MISFLSEVSRNVPGISPPKTGGLDAMPSTTPIKSPEGAENFKLSFDYPYIFKDGFTISEAKCKKMSRLSWAIPIQTFLRLR